MKQAPDWSEVADVVRKHVVRIESPGGSGTGFLFTYSRVLCGIATAAHVIDHAYWWEEPIRLEHPDTGTTVLLRHADRAVLIDRPSDSAAIVAPKGVFPFPADEVLELVEEDKHLRRGNPIGWLGFPAISTNNLCFFLGTASCWLASEHAYLVDGVAINGVSGGPAFWAVGDAPIVIGVVSAYIPNRATGEALPGLCVVRDVKHLYEVVRRLRSFDEARAQEAQEKVKEKQAEEPERPQAEQGRQTDGGDAAKAAKGVQPKGSEPTGLRGARTRTRKNR